MNTTDLELINVHVRSLVDAIERNTEKVQELLDRVECIDNTLDEFRDNQDENFRPNVLEWLARLHKQGRP